MSTTTIGTYGFKKTAAEIPPEAAEKLKKMIREMDEEEGHVVPPEFEEGPPEQEQARDLHEALTMKTKPRTETPMDPKEIEEGYRQVGEEEWDERHGGVSVEEHDKLEWPAKGIDADWLEQKEKGVTNPPEDQEMFLPEGPRGEFEEAGETYEEEDDWRNWMERRKAEMKSKLIKMANKLDGKGLYDEANAIDEIIKGL